MGDLMLASVSNDICLWESTNWGLLRQYNPHAEEVSSVSWSCDGTFFGSTSVKDDKVSLSYVKNNTVTTSELNCGPGQQCLDFNSNARFLLTGGVDSVVSVWDLKTRKVKSAFKEHKGPVTSAQFNWNDSYIASGSETGEIILHHVVTGQSSSPLVAPKVEAIRQLQYNHYKKSLLGSVSDDGAVNLWDTNTRRLLHSFNKVHLAPATGLSFSPLNEILMLSVGLDQRLVCYDLQGKRTLKVMTVESPLTSVDVMHNGATVAVGSTRGKIFIYDLRRGVTPVRMFPAHKSSIHCLKFQPNFDFKKTDSANSSGQSASRRQLPAAPRNLDVPSNSTASGVAPSERSYAGLASAAIVDVVSPLRDVEPHQGGDGRPELSGNRSGNLSIPSSHQDDSGQGLFSPLSNNIGVGNTSDTSLQRRQNFADRGLSPLVQNAGIHSQAGFMRPERDTTPRVGHSDQGEGHLDGDVALHNGHADFGHSPARRKQSPKGICASPSLPSMHMHLPSETSADAAEGDVTDGRTAYPQVNSDSPRGTRASSRVDSRHSSPSTSNPNTTSQQLRHLVRDAMRDYTEHMQEELKTMFRQATAQSPSKRQNQTASDTSIFQTEFLRNLIHEALEEFREDIHRDLQNIHLEMLRQFRQQQVEVLGMLEYHSVNKELVAEVERLREENKRLKKNF